MSHSKRNTSRAVFTSHERDLARRAWGENTARLTRESYLPFASCVLCLEVARDPVACAHGDLFCRECALSNILAQKKEIKRLERAREQEEREAEETRKQQEEEAHERAVREFELTQIGLEAKVKNRNDAATSRSGNTVRGSDSNGRGEGSPPATENPDSSAKPERNGKRKFEMDEEELARIAREDRAKARRAIDEETASRPTLPSFWTPSVTPSSNTRHALHEIVKKAKSTPMCPGSHEDAPHPYSLHTLITVNFAEEEEEDPVQSRSRAGDGDGKKKTRARVCPSCKKGLSNASKAMLAKPCGHVVCRSCVDKFMRPSHQHRHHHDPHAPADEAERLRCYVCEADLTEDKTKNSGNKDGNREKGARKKEKEKIQPGLVELRSEGTGFSAGGANQVQKSGVSFQC
ncbi:ENOS interacting protein [Durotheca rogersii]|uniref:ENOS interacting protein n=1 Tax=Durotheca rogersii TaxID=419775 RepID=UPI00221F0255|nr:ENOS interacting protein [Durotheca rogersii]KAI5863238.1 ENOS interacting protein [Durotheca rogersii]